MPEMSLRPFTRDQREELAEIASERVIVGYILDADATTDELLDWLETYDPKGRPDEYHNWYEWFPSQSEARDAAWLRLHTVLFEEG